MQGKNRTLVVDEYHLCHCLCQLTQTPTLTLLKHGWTHGIGPGTAPLLLWLCTLSIQILSLNANLFCFQTQHTWKSTPFLPERKHFALCPSVQKRGWGSIVELNSCLATRVSFFYCLTPLTKQSWIHLKSLDLLKVTFMFNPLSVVPIGDGCLHKPVHLMIK